MLNPRAMTTEELEEENEQLKEELRTVKRDLATAESNHMKCYEELKKEKKRSDIFLDSAYNAINIKDELLKEKERVVSNIESLQEWIDNNIYDKVDYSIYSELKDIVSYLV